MYSIEIYKTSLNVFIRGSRAGDSPRFKGSERDAPSNQGGAPKAETIKAARQLGGPWNIQDLEWMGWLLPCEEGEERKILV